MDLEKELTKEQLHIDETPLIFGKYRGRTPDWISERDPSYIIWMWEEFDNPPCSRALYRWCCADIDGDSEDGLL